MMYDSVPPYRSAKRFAKSAELSPQDYTPGRIVELYARRKGWPLAKHMLMVEGPIDVLYLELAADMHYRKSGFKLLDETLAIFPPGEGSEGGTEGIVREFRTLFGNIYVDFEDNKERDYVAKALLDDDYAGRQTCSILKSDYRMAEYRDYFRLNRSLPRENRDHQRLRKLTEAANSGWSSIYCEMEDLVAYDLLEDFAASDPSCLERRKCALLPNAHHFEFLRGHKRRLFDHVSQNCMYEDMVLIVDLLKSIRFWFGLDSEGVDFRDSTRD